MHLHVDRWLEKIWMKPETELLRRQKEMAYRFQEVLEKERAPETVWEAMFEEGLKFIAEEYEDEI